MPTLAREHFNRNAQDIDNLIGLYQIVVGELFKDDPEQVSNALEVLLRSAVVLIVSHWEAYIEDIADEAL